MGAELPKAFIRCAGRELWEWSAEVLASVCDRVVMAVPMDRLDPDTGAWAGADPSARAGAGALAGGGPDAGVGADPGVGPEAGVAADAGARADARLRPRRRGRIERIAGGTHRSESVRNALRAAPDASIVVVHDAARPFASAELFSACIAEIEAGWDAAIAAAPVTDTIKEADADRRVTRTLERSRLWSIQTPQAFEAGILSRALEGDLATATDDAVLVEAIGGRVRIVESTPRNFKITWPEDLERAEALLC